jgi:hypothetical protein
VQRCKGHEIELQPELPLDLLALILLDAVPFVDGDDQRAPALQRDAQYACILLGDRVVGVQHHDHHVRLIDRLQRLGDTGALDDILHLRAAAHAGRIDQHEGAAIALERHQNAVTRGARFCAGDHPLIPDQAVDERRLADIRPADDGNADGAELILFRGLRLEALQHLLHQALATLTVTCEIVCGRAEAERAWKSAATMSPSTPRPC